MVGRSLGHYRILELLGKGGMGEVYLAEDSKLGRRVALKVLSSELGEDRDRRDRFEREARAAAALNHPNIVTIHSVEEIEGVPFLTLELVEGKTLSEVIPEAGMSLDRLLPLAIQLTDAVGAAHQKGITHRDLKPANVMVTADSRVKVLDFGLAKLREELSQAVQGSMPTQQLTGEGRILGTVAYMSPEQAEGRQVDPRSDVFSLGVMLYEMSTGRRPFTGDTHLSVLSAILRDTPSSVTEIKKDLPRELARLIQRCLAKDPEDRYQTAKDLRNDLRALREDLTSGDLTKSIDVQRAAAARNAPAPAGSRSKMPLIAAGAVLVIGGIVAAIYFAGGGDGGGDRASATVDPFASITLTRLTTTGTAGRAAISGDGRYAAYVVTENRRQSLWLRQVTTSSNVQIVPAGDAVYDAVTFSPDGDYVLYVTYAPNQNLASLYQVPVLGGGPRKLVEDIDTAPAFSPDGRHFAFLRGIPGEGTALMIADANGGSLRTLMTRKLPEDFQLDALAWSRDGHRLAGVGLKRDTFKASIILIDAETGAESTLGSHDWRSLSYVAWHPGGRHLLVNGVEGTGGETSSQVFSVAVPDGTVTRVTNDLSTYQGLSISADGQSFLTVRNETRSRIWTLDGGNVDAGLEIIAGSGTDDGVSGLAWTPDGRIVYAASTTGNLDIWVMETSGANRVQLTNTPADEYLPAVTADGKYIVFVSDRDGPRTLYRMGIDGSVQTDLGVGAVTFRPVLSFDGKWVYYSTQELGNFRIAVEGGKPEPLLSELTAGGRTLPPRFHEPTPSPDGRAIAGHYQDPKLNGERIAVLSLDPAAEERRFPEVAANARWAPDGRSLLFNRRGNLHRQPLGGGPSSQITKFTGDDIFAFAVSPDQKRWAVVRGNVVSDVVLVTRRTK